MSRAMRAPRRPRIARLVGPLVAPLVAACWLGWGVVGSAACGGAPTAPPVTATGDSGDSGDPAGSGADPADAAALLARVESAVTSAPVLAIEASISSEGAFPARLDGRAVVIAQDRVELAFDGSFGDQAVTVRFASDGATMTGDVPAPPHLAEAIVIGMVRMGLLHNLAVLIGGGAPDHGEGGVREWVVARRVRFAPPRAGPAANEAVVMFDLEVAGQPSGEVSLWIDTERALPTSRVQTVHFESGEMTVRESYRIRVGAAANPSSAAGNTRPPRRPLTP